MSVKIKIYSAEAELAEVIQKNNSIAYCVEATSEKAVNSEDLLDRLKKHVNFSKADEDINILYQTKSILVSTVWNKNDDIFGPKQTWAARRTPVYTYSDIGHEHQQIVGCITDTWVIDNKGEIVAEDTAEDDLPEKFHICNSAVIWRYYKDEDLVARAETLIEEIEEGKKFVSMECLFADFDYGVISPENKYFTVARNEETAFLTKHLRMYGGSGSYDGYKIGRFIKKMVFSGKGYVDKPANPESVIFNDETEINFSESNFKERWFDKKAELIMANENTNEVESLKVIVADLQKKLADANVKSFEEDIKELRDELAQSSETNVALSTENKTLQAKVVEVEASTKSLNDKIVESNTANEELAKKVEAVNAEKIKSDRISVLVDGGIDKIVAVEKVEKFASLNDEQFVEIANTLVEAQKKADEYKKDKDKDKKDDKPADKKAEADANDDKVLDSAKANDGDAAGSVSDDNITEAEQVRSSIASFIQANL